LPRIFGRNRGVLSAALRKEETMDPQELKEILAKHLLYLQGDPNGVQADLSWANLKGANLSWANLEGADLTGSDLERASLYRANLEGANLKWADLTGTDLTGTTLRNSKR